MKTPRGISESSTTSDNTTEFIDIVKRYDVVYNTHNPDYKNVEVKMKVWTQIAEEIGLSVDASKRKWKNLRDSYTKYLRSFRIGTKTSKKYQYWAHADHMDFLKPFQGPGRNSTNVDKVKTNDDEDTECDLGYQVLTKASTSSEDDLKVSLSSNGVPVSNTFSSSSSSSSTPSAVQAIATIPPTLNSNITTAATAISPNASLNIPLALTSNSALTATSNMPPISAAAAAAAAAAALAMLPIPSLPTVQLPPQLSNKPLMTPLSTSIFPLPQLSSTGKPTALQLPVCSSASSSVGCLIIEPQLFASADTFKKELGAPTLGLVSSITSQATSTAPSSRINPPLISKIRRVQPSPQTAAINLSFSANSNTNANQPPPSKVRKVQNERNGDIDVAAILQANRELDANTLFFLSLSRTVRSMPTKFQSLAKMRCMRIVSDIELELDNADNTGEEQNTTNGNVKYAGVDSPSPPAVNSLPQNTGMNEGATEHFVYVMSPSRVESMIDLSSDEDATNNGG